MVGKGITVVPGRSSRGSGGAARMDPSTYYAAPLMPGWSESAMASSWSW